jgi:Flp pilus assembly pilin Flp
MASTVAYLLNAVSIVGRFTKLSEQLSSMASKVASFLRAVFIVGYFTELSKQLSSLASTVASILNVDSIVETNSLNYRKSYQVWRLQWLL